MFKMCNVKYIQYIVESINKFQFDDHNTYTTVSYIFYTIY